MVHTIHSVLNTSVKVSGSAHHYVPDEASCKLCQVDCVRLRLDYVMLGSVWFGYISFLYFITQKLSISP